MTIYGPGPDEYLNENHFLWIIADHLRSRKGMLINLDRCKRLETGARLTGSSDDLWQPMTDERIRAAIPMAPEGALIFGARGLAAVDRPMLILVGTEDTGCDYRRESVFIFEHASTPDKGLISFIGEDHGMLFREEPYFRMKHFVTAFFGYHLQGKEEYQDYFSEKFVSKREGLAWGVYEK